MSSTSRIQVTGWPWFFYYWFKFYFVLLLFYMKDNCFDRKIWFELVKRQISFFINLEYQPFLKTEMKDLSYFIFITECIYMKKNILARCFCRRRSVEWSGKKLKVWIHGAVMNSALLLWFYSLSIYLLLSIYFPPLYLSICLPGFDFFCKQQVLFWTETPHSYERKYGKTVSY